MDARERSAQVDSSRGLGRVVVIGSGACGLAAARNFLAAGFDVVALERRLDLGGNWLADAPASGVLRSTHLISSKRTTEFVDFPMPADYPAYPSQSQALAYLRSYADAFGLRRVVRFGTEVIHAAPTRGGVGWTLTTRATESGVESRERCDFLVVANGHHWNPVWPKIPGEFAGRMIHGQEYGRETSLAGLRTLVIGGGNSGCDIAVDASATAARVVVSLRRGYHFLPKFLFGKPIDECGLRLRRWGLPLTLRRFIARVALRVAVGPPERYGLPKPDHRLYETHPIVNSQLPYYVGHGRVAVRPDVTQFEGRAAVFADGSREEFDLVVCATGYRVEVPFLDQSLPLDQQGRSRLWLNAFDPERDDVFFAGFIQPDGGIWGLADLQTKIAAEYAARATRDRSSVAWFDALRRRGATDLSFGVRYERSPRHALEVEYYGFRRALEQLLARIRRA